LEVSTLYPVALMPSLPREPPCLEIRPRIVHFRTNLNSDLARVMLANSITLTPGTITVDIDDREFYVHALSDKVAKDLLTGEMERRVSHVFLEPESVDTASNESKR